MTDIAWQDFNQNKYEKNKFDIVSFERGWDLGGKCGILSELFHFITQVN